MKSPTRAERRRQDREIAQRRRAFEADLQQMRHQAEHCCDELQRSGRFCPECPFWSLVE